MSLALMTSCQSAEDSDNDVKDNKLVHDYYDDNPSAGTLTAHHNPSYNEKGCRGAECRHLGGSPHSCQGS